ncbi:hypothetical protein BOX15_Mlig021547g1 [Macrostomum lignano]|uniref:BSD domain-containing protein n=2 Tax=Macrostomum lignano TaxID=282301 RepID=A0A1I8JH78_9PLAT|nr:hypothetical protein BOX15_Mlig021547g1 [Macrostomum lignano]
MEEEASKAVGSSSAGIPASATTDNVPAAMESSQDTQAEVTVAPATDESNEAGCGSSNSWLNMGSWLSYAKEQSATVYQSTRSQSAQVWGFVKKDLGEFASTLKADTKAVYEQVRASSGVEGEDGGASEGGAGHHSDTTQRLRSGLSSLVSTVANAMYIPPDDSDEQALVVTKDGEVCAHDWEKSRIDALKADPATFLTDPQGQPEAFLAFLSEFNADSEQQEISELLMSSSELRSLYSQLVPAEMPHKHFWARYYFRVRAIRDTARQRQELKRRAAAAATTTAAAASAAAAAPGGAAVEDLDSISWDDYDEDEPVVPDAAAAGNEDKSHQASDSLKLCERGDTIVVRHPASGSSEEGSSGGSGRGAAQQQTPAAQPPVDLHPPAAASASATKILTLDADVDEDLDIDDVELTEEDLKRARELAVGGGGAAADEEDEDLGEDDWGKWE